MSQSSMRKLIGWKFLENRWALVPVVMLSCTVIGATAMVTLALGDGSATAAEPDSYRKGAAWDETNRQIAENGIDVPIRINGQWEIRVTIEANGKIYSDRFRRHIAFVAPSALGVTSSAKGFDQ